MTSLTAHPLAEFWPILPDVLEEVTESIRENGLRQPVVLDVDGQIIDGRTRYAACQALGIEPETVVYEGRDVLEYIRDANGNRRHVSTGARAMIIAQMMVAEGLRKDGKWQYGRLNSEKSQNSTTMQTYVTRAGVILDWLPELAVQVVAGSLNIDLAYEQARDARNKVDADKQKAAIEASRKREATIKEKQENDRKLQALTEATSRYLAQVEAGNMSIAAAYAAHMEDTRKHRERERELDMGRRDSCTHIAEAVRMIAGGTGHAEVFLRDFYPHEERFLAYGMRLTRERIDSAIEFLTVLKKEVTL